VQTVTLKHSSPGIGNLTPRGPLSEAAIARLSSPPDPAPFGADIHLGTASPLEDEDLQLSLYLLHEIDYRSLPGIDEGWEWQPALIELRNRLDDVFLAAVDAAVGPFAHVPPSEVAAELFRLEREDDGPALSRFVEVHADVDQFREFMMHRSLYQRKEADPHSWAIPRLAGPAKAALVEVQADEYGGGNPARVHSELFANSMRELGLDPRENAYLDRIPAPTIATVNLMSALGKRRARRGAIVGHLAMFEITSAGPNRRYGNALRRLGFGPAATDIYDEHVEADSVHENIAAYDLAQALATAEPRLAAEVQFGARALLRLEARFAARLLDRWHEGRSSLL